MRVALFLYFGIKPKDYLESFEKSPAAPSVKNGQLVAALEAEYACLWVEKMRLGAAAVDTILSEHRVVSCYSSDRCCPAEQRVACALDDDNSPNASPKIALLYVP